MRVLIIEDEVSARNHLLKLLKALPEPFEVLGSLATVEESIHWFQTNNEPDLVFMDIHLSDGISFDIFSELSIECPIIYITAYDQYAIQAFKTTGIDYLLKPVTEEELKIAVQKFKKVSGRPGDDWLMKNLEALTLLQGANTPTYTQRFLFKTGTQLVPVKAGQIAWFHRKDALVWASLFDGRSLLADQPLNHLQKQLDPRQFFRLNRQLLVNLEAIEKLSSHKPGQVEVLLKPAYADPLYLSQERSARLKAVLGDA